MTYRKSNPSESSGPPVGPVEWVVIDREDATNRVVVVAQLAHEAWRKSLIKRGYELLEFSDVDVRLKDEAL